MGREGKQGDQPAAHAQGDGQPRFDRERVVLALIGLAGAAYIIAANFGS